METSRTVRRWHRYLAVFVGVQFLLWIVGGLYFSWSDLDGIRGEHLRKKAPLAATKEALVSPSSIAAHLEAEDRRFAGLTSLNLVRVLDRPVYQVGWIAKDGTTHRALFDAQTAQPYRAVDRDHAIEIARRSAAFDAPIAEIAYLEETGPHHEYREKPLPAWAITFDHAGAPTFYVAEKLGTLTAVRHNRWRIFDFLWMLHTMDFLARDDFNNTILRVVAPASLIVAVSGYLLFWYSSPIRRRRLLRKPNAAEKTPTAK